MKVDLGALRLAKEGRLYDLSSGWWRRMPGSDAHARFEIVTYRTPNGVRVLNDLPAFAQPGNEVGAAIVSDLLIGTTHTGTHIDALAHVVAGEDASWHGGDAAADALGDFGPLTADASTLEPIIARGVMLDIPALLGKPALDAEEGVGAEQIEGALARQGVEVIEGDVVLIRTGQMASWPDVEAMAASAGAGLAIDGARWLSERGIRAVGADTEFVEVMPSGVPGNPLPVHVHLLKECGTPIIEWVDCEELARDAVSEMLFLALPLNVSGATGSMLRPVAIV